jgi:hypothetical protein
MVLQVAICTALLAGAGLLVRTLRELNATNPGFDRDQVVSFTVDPMLAGYTSDQADALRLALIDGVRALPGVASVGSSSILMRGSGMKFTVVLPGQKTQGDDSLNVSINKCLSEILRNSRDKADIRYYVPRWAQ